MSYMSKIIGVVEDKVEERAKKRRRGVYITIKAMQQYAQMHLSQPNQPTQPPS